MRKLISYIVGISCLAAITVTFSGCGENGGEKAYGDNGKIIDNDRDGDIDENDWENAWGEYLNDKYDEYGY